MKILKKIILCFAIMQTFCFISYASEEEILQEQKDSLNIGSFMEEADKYSAEAFPELDINELLNSAIKGEVDTGIIYKAILAILGEEVVSSIRVLRQCLDCYRDT